MTKVAVPMLLLTLGTLAACGSTTQEKAASGAGGGLVAGALVGGPVGAVAGAAVGAGAGTAADKVENDGKATHTARAAGPTTGITGSSAPAATAETAAVPRPASGSGYAYGDR